MVLKAKLIYSHCVCVITLLQTIPKHTGKVFLNRLKVIDAAAEVMHLWRSSFLAYV